MISTFNPQELLNKWTGWHITKESAKNTQKWPSLIFTWIFSLISYKRTYLGHSLWFTLFLTLFRMDIFGAAHGWSGGQKICHTYPTMMKLGSYTLSKEDPKKIWIMWHTHWILVTSAFSLPEISKFRCIKKPRYGLHFST